MYEVKSRKQIGKVCEVLLGKLQSILTYEKSPAPFEQRNHSKLSEDQEKICKIQAQAIAAIAIAYQDDTNVLCWLKERAQSDDNLSVRQDSVRQVARIWKNHQDTFPWLKHCLKNDPDQDTRHAAARELSLGWRGNVEVFHLLKETAKNDIDEDVRRRAIWELAKGWKNNFEVLDILCDCAINDPFQRKWEDHTIPRQAAIQKIIEFYIEHPKAQKTLEDRALNDPDEKIRKESREAVSNLRKRGKRKEM